MSFTNIHLNIDLSICNQFRSNVLHISQIKVFFFCVWKGGLATNKFDFRIFIIKEYQKNMPLISDKDTMSLEALTCMIMSLKMYFFSYRSYRKHIFWACHQQTITFISYRLLLKLMKCSAILKSLKTRIFIK